MNKLLPVLLITSIGCAGAAAYLHRSLDEERLRSVALQARIADLERLQAAARADRPVAEIPETSSDTPPPAALSAAPPVEAVTTSPAQMTPESARKMRERFARQQQTLLNDPDYREAMRVQQRLGLSRRMPDLAQELGISPELADQLLDLLTDQQLRAQSEVALSGRSDPTQADEMQRRAQERNRIQQSEIAQLLGDAGLQRWQDYQNSTAARFRVKQLADAFDTAGVPLDEYQHTQLRATLTERDRQGRAEQQNQLQNIRPFRSAADSLAFQEQQLEQTARNYELSRAAVAGILSSRQMQIYQDIQDSELTLRRARLQMQRAQANALEGEANAAQTTTVYAADTFIGGP